MGIGIGWSRKNGREFFSVIQKKKAVSKSVVRDIVKEDPLSEPFWSEKMSMRDFIWNMGSSILIFIIVYLFV